jgi:hypothetical protein
VTTDTEYVPASEVPTLDQLRADMKKAAKEHPDYGTCPHCIKAVRVDKMGFLRAHSTPELAMGNMKASYHCPGVGVRYAEHGDFGQTWDLKNGRFTDLNVDIPVLLVAHPASTVGLPIWQLSDIPATELSRQAAKKLLDGEKWRIELVFDDRNVTGHLIRLDRGDRGPVVWDSHTEGQAFGGIMEVVSRLVARLASADFTDAVAARSE